MCVSRAVENFVKLAYRGDVDKLNCGLVALKVVFSDDPAAADRGGALPGVVAGQGVQVKGEGEGRDVAC